MRKRDESANEPCYFGVGVKVGGNLGREGSVEVLVTWQVPSRWRLCCCWVRGEVTIIRIVSREEEAEGCYNDSQRTRLLGGGSF